MPIEINAPDGSIARFPDGTSDDVILKVMRESFGGPAAAPAFDPREGAPPTLKSDTPLAASRFGDFLKPYLGGHNPIAEVTDLVAPALNVTSERSIGQRVQDTANFAAELPVRMATRGEYGLSDIGATGAGESAQRFAENNPDLLNVVNAVGSVAPGVTGTQGMGAPRMPKVEKPEPMPTPRQLAVEAADRIDVPLPYAVASDSRAVNATAGALGSTMLGSPLQGAARRTTEALGKAAERVADDLAPGSSGTSYSGGSAAKEGIVDWIKGGSKEIIGRGYDDLYKLIKPDTMVPLSKTRTAVNELTNLDTMSASTDGAKVINLVRDAVNRPEGLSYQGLKELRTRIGERVFGDIAPEQGTSARALDKLYGALSEDLKFGVQRAGIGKKGSSGAKALEAFEAANAQARETFAIRDKLKSIVGAEADAAPERVFERIVQMAGAKGNADFQKLALAKNAIGNEKWGEVAGAVVRQMGRDADGNFSPARFLTAYGKMSENGKSVLFGRGDESLRGALDDIATVSRKFEDTISRFNNKSLTGNTVLGTMGLAGVLTNPLATAGSAIGGVTLSWLLSRPAGARSVANWSKAYLQAATKPSPATKQLLEAATRGLHAAAGA